MAINNCFYIKNIGVSPVSVGNSLSPGFTYGYDYSLNNTEDWQTGVGFTTITLNPLDTVYFKGDTTWSTQSGVSEDWFFLRSLDETHPLEIGGSVMSLIHDGDGNDESQVAGCTFGGMFAGLKCPLHIDQLKLPSRVSRNYFTRMFRGCSGLQSIPAGLLPATTLAPNCYDSMFAQCTGLTSIPENLLPATVLSERCYSGMFSQCHGITVVPEGLFCAEELADYCYEAMFSQSNGLKEIHFPFKSWGTYTFSWVWEVPSDGTFYCPIELPDEYSESCIPIGWKRIPPKITKKPFSTTFLNKIKIGGRTV